MNSLWSGFWIGAALLALVGFVRIHPHYRALALAFSALRANPGIWAGVAVVLAISSTYPVLRGGYAPPGPPSDPAVGASLPGDLQFWKASFFALALPFGRLLLAPWEASPAACLLVMLGLLGWRQAPSILLHGADNWPRRIALAAVPCVALAWAVTALFPILGKSEILLGWSGHSIQFAARIFEWLASLLLLAWVFLSLARVLEKNPLALSLEPIHLVAKRVSSFVSLAFIATLLEHIPGWVGYAPLARWLLALVGLELLVLAPLVYLLVFLSPRPGLLGCASTAFHFQMRAWSWFPWFLLLAAVALVPLLHLDAWATTLSKWVAVPVVLALSALRAFLTTSLVATWFVLMQQKEFRAIGKTSEAAKLK